MHQYYHFKEATILNVLYYLRSEIIRNGADGQDHVDALLVARGADPEARPVPERRPKLFGRGELRPAILRSLRERPKTVREIAREISNDPRAVKSVRNALGQMKGAGLVEIDDEHGAKVWTLAP